jgi:hypothetical protein
MADRRALGKLGWAFGAVTVAVLLTAAVVVKGQLDGWSSDGRRPLAAAALSATTR